MVRITPVEAQSRFSYISELALNEPVSITGVDGADSLVLISVAEYERLKALDTRKSYYVWELPEDIVAALEKEEAPEWTEKYNSEVC